MTGEMHALPWISTSIVLISALVAAVIALVVLRIVVRHLLNHKDALATVLRRCEQPAALALALLTLEFALFEADPFVAHVAWFDALRHAVTIALLVALTWLGTRALSGAEEAINLRHPADADDDPDTRRLQTQTRVLSRVGVLLVGSIGLGAILMTFPSVRHFGASILASAGVAGIVIGLAARPVLTNLLAGLQIALTRPILLNDLLVVQDQQGRVEEITGTYVVLRLGDGRRLIVPLQWFIENQFLNLTRTPSQMTGQVSLWVDYALPLAPLRAELERVARAAAEWDGGTAALHVNDADAHAMQLRIVLSSRDSASNGALRDKVREALIDFLQREYPAYLPRVRIDQQAGHPSHGAHRPS